MLTQDAMKLFWPSHLCSPKCQQGYLIGWYNASNSICVASVVPNVKVKFDELHHLLNETRTSGEHFDHINKVCNVSPRILGYLNVEQQCKFPVVNPEQEIWLNITLNPNYIPVPLSVNINNKKLVNDSYQVIFYEQPNPKGLQFLSLNPLELDISVSSPVLVRENRAHISPLEQITQCSHQLNDGGKKRASANLDMVLIQINSSYFLEHGVDQLPFKYKQKNSSDRVVLVYFLRFIHSLWTWLVRNVITNPKWFIGYYIRKLVVRCSMCILFLVLALAEVTLQALSIRLPPFILNGVAFKDLFAAGQQIDLRLQQLFFWPRQYVMLRKQNWANTAKARAHYISMWLVANDIIIGLAVGSFLMANKYIMAENFHDILHKYTVKSLESMVLWFLESPAGLKLNGELASFLSELFLWLLRIWTICPQAVEPYTPQIIHAIGLSGVFGVTMLISLSSDFLACMTLHVYCFYMVAARIFNWQLNILYSLFNLFRGKKKNVLRNRIDSCDYDLDQLLLGTSLFTLLTFLFPTVFIYYLTFALGRVGVIFLQAVMGTILAFFNHFPLFAIMLRIKDPRRLPGGLRFDVFDYDCFALKHRGIFHSLWFKKSLKRRVTFKLYESPKTMPPQENLGKGTYLWMRNIPISMSAIFFQYMLLWKRLSAHYFSAYVFTCLLYGEPIKPIPKLQYPMLPDTRPSLDLLWQTFKSNILEVKKKK
ncbi:hypothetical protein G6F56_002191 [Rhizopus delemar]|nr:hypothetical protein G6F56_002191 [Rhizopus delemar]